MTKFKDYEDLMETGLPVTKKQVAPEDEVFKSLYIAGIARKDETTGEMSQPGKLQIRGLKSNLTEVNFIITHVKNVLVNEKPDSFNKKQQKMVCFSFQSGPRPWYGTSGKMCGSNRGDRQNDPFCQSCRGQILIAGIYCDEEGLPVMNKDGKPEFIFIRGKGMKFKNVSDYIYELSQLELDPFFDDDSDEAKRFEKMVVNQKRFITKASQTTAPSDYGDKYVFKLERTKQLDNKTVEKILALSKKTLKEFNEKFDWSLGNVANYGQQSQAPNVDKGQQFDEPENTQPQTKETENKETKKDDKKIISFDDIDF